MSLRLNLATSLAIALVSAMPLVAFASEDGKPAKAASENPFFSPSPLPYHFPQFDKIHNEDYEPAFDKGMADNRAEIEAIANNPQAATFENTIIDLSRSGYGSSAPHWAMDGKAIVYLSDRDGMKNHASWGGQGDAYAIFLTKAAYDDLKMTKEEADLAKEEKEKKEEEKDEKAGKKKEDKKKDEEKDKKIEPLEFDLDGINDRRVRLTPNSSDLSGAILSKDGEKVWYLAAFEKGTDLWQYEMRTRDVKILHKMGNGWCPAGPIIWCVPGR